MPPVKMVPSGGCTRWKYSAMPAVSPSTTTGAFAIPSRVLTWPAK